MIFEYEGTDITEHVELSRCVHESRAWGAVPWLSVEFEDDGNLWDRWGPQPGDRISVSEDGAAATGALFVDSVEPSSGGYALHATALPVYDARAVREWRDTTALTVARQLAGVLGLKFSARGLSDMALAYVRQDDERALAVVERLAALSGGVVDVYDGTLHLCGRDWVEAQAAAGALSLGGDAEYEYRRGKPFASCRLVQPKTDNGQGIDEATGAAQPQCFAVLPATVALPGSAELRRACKSVLAYRNEHAAWGWSWDDELAPYSPGAVVDVECDAAPSLSGRGVVTRIRNDFSDDMSKTWWRRIDGNG